MTPENIPVSKVVDSAIEAYNNASNSITNNILTALRVMAPSVDQLVKIVKEQDRLLNQQQKVIESHEANAAADAKIIADLRSQLKTQPKSKSRK